MIAFSCALRQYDFASSTKSVSQRTPHPTHTPGALAGSNLPPNRPIVKTVPDFRHALVFFACFGNNDPQPIPYFHEVPMRARIYQPARSAMQSGMGKTKVWVLEFAQASGRQIDPLMGWTASDDTETQVKLQFDSREAALAYAASKGIEAEVQEPKLRKPVLRPGGYGENFATARKGAWTH